METITITLPSSGNSVLIQLERKKMKTCRLKVYPEQKIVLSLPHTVPIDWAEKFLLDKSEWIETKLQLFQKTIGYAATTEIKNGYSIKMLGEDMIFVLSACDKDCVYAEEKLSISVAVIRMTPKKLNRCSKNGGAYKHDRSWKIV